MTATLTDLPSVATPADLAKLEAIGVRSLRELAEFPPCRDAETVLALVARGNLASSEFDRFFHGTVAVTPDYLMALPSAKAGDLSAVDAALGAALEAEFAVRRVRDLVAFAPYREARAAVFEQVEGAFYEPPSAPRALLPDPVGSTQTTARFVSFVRDRPFSLPDYALKIHFDFDEPRPSVMMAAPFLQAALSGHFGYLAPINQRWVNAGTGLGEPVYSIALAPGESRNIAMIDWVRRQSSARREDTDVAETLSNTFLQTRALSEVISATAREHQDGRTDVTSATETTGESKTSGWGAGKSSAVSGEVDLSATGYPISAGVADDLGVSGSVGKSTVQAESKTVGTLIAETNGERSITADVVQNISDLTEQNASTARSLMSTVVIDDEQAERRGATTRNITNYNHSHALTMQYFEVLQRYRVLTAVGDLQPLMLLPFRPYRFTMEFIQDHWELLRGPLRRALPRAVFREFAQVIREYERENTAFDLTDPLRITAIEFQRSRSWSAPIMVRITGSNPEVTLAIDGRDLTDMMEFRMRGASSFVSYQVLRRNVHSQSEFGTRESFALEPDLRAEIDVSFDRAVRRAMKRYLDDPDMTPKVADVSREPNELGLGSKRRRLKEKVDAGEIKYLNLGDVEFALTIDMTISFEDANGQTERADHSLSVSMDAQALHDTTLIDLGLLAQALQDRLAAQGDANPAAAIDDIIGHFTTYRYHYTARLLAGMEKAQFVDLIENLGFSDDNGTRRLTEFIDPNPVMIAENLVGFRLREPDFARGHALSMRMAISAEFSASHDSELNGSLVGFALRSETVAGGGPKTVFRMFLATPARPYQVIGILNLMVDFDREGPLKPVRGRVIRRRKGEEEPKQIFPVQGTLEPADGGKTGRPDGTLTLRVVGDEKHSFQIVIGSRDAVGPELSPITAAISAYLKALEARQDALAAADVVRDVYLPTSGVFGEAILGRSNASEYLNARRFWNWQDSPIPHAAPDVTGVDLAQDFAQPIAEGLAPNQPVSVLNQMLPQSLPAPALAQALEAIQNGGMFRDMSKSRDLTSVLGDLADLARATAEQAGSLSGEAQRSALNGAIEMGRQVASMLEKTAAEPQSPPKPAARTPSEGEAEDNKKILDKKPEPSTPKAPSTGQKEYLVSVSLIDETNEPYDGELNVLLFLDEYQVGARRTDITGNQSEEIEYGRVIGLEPVLATPGRHAYLYLEGILSEDIVIRSREPFFLPDRPIDVIDLPFEVAMGEREESWEAVTFSEAVDQWLVGGNAKFDMGTVLGAVLSGDVKLPFKLSGDTKTALGRLLPAGGTAEIGLEPSGGARLTPQQQFAAAYTFSGEYGETNESGERQTRRWSFTVPTMEFEIRRGWSGG